MKKICFLLPSLIDGTSPIRGLSIIIDYLSANYDVYVVGVLDKEIPKNNYFINANVILIKNNNIFHKIASINNINADVYISSLFQSDIICFFLNKKKISFVRGDLFNSYRLDKGFLIGFIMFMSHMISLSLFDKVTTLTRQNAIRLILTKKSRIKVIRNFIDEENITKHPYPNKGTLHLLFAGHLTRRKGIISAIKVVHSLINKSYKIKLTILGKGQEEDFIKKYIILNSLENSIVLVGNVDNIYDYINKTNYTILPSYSEGTSRFILESLYCGRKTITRNTSGIDEVLSSENSYLFKTNNELKLLLIKLIESKIYINDPCKIYPQVFDKKTNLKIIENEIEQLANN